MHYVIMLPEKTAIVGLSKSRVEPSWIFSRGKATSEGREEGATLLARMFSIA
jgi:hypothetical protein